MTTQALNIDTRVPHQVRDRAQRARDALKPIEPETPPGDPAAAPVEPAPAAPIVADIPLPDPRDALSIPDPKSDPYWAARFKTAEGLWKRHKEQLETQVEALQTRMTELEGDLRKQNVAQPIIDDEIDLTQFFTPEQIEQVGEDVARMMAKTSLTAARKATQAEIAKTVEPMRERETSRAKSEQERRVQTMLEAITEEVPNWQEIDKDARWLAYLAEDDEVTGMSRQDLIDAAKSRYDGKRIAKMLKQYISSFSTTPAPVVPSVTPQGSAPGGAGGGELPQMPAEGFPTRAEIKEFYKKLAIHNKPSDPYHISDEAKAKFEARVAAAQAAGVY